MTPRLDQKPLGPRLPTDADRKAQLEALAAGGDENAAADLYHEFGIQFPTTGKTENQQDTQEER